MVPVLLIAVLLGWCGALSPEILVKEQWQSYKLQYKKTYLGQTEEQYRLKIFMHNLHQINEHNKLYEMGASTYKLGLNQFSDLLHAEFLKMYATNQTDHQINDIEEALVHGFADVDMLRDAVDWRTRGAVTPVKSQGNCHSSWAFGATGALEAQWFRKTGKLVSLSEQNIVDCVSNSYTSHGCGGGFAYGAYQYIITNGGIDTEASYPYQAKYLQCRYDESHVGAIAHNFAIAERNSEVALQNVVSHIGPAAAIMDISLPDMKTYSGGIYDNPSCILKDIIWGHTVLVIGYGSENGRDYWLAKNSWGTTWGEQGYLRLARNKNNQCGIANLVVYPVV